MKYKLVDTSRRRNLFSDEDERCSGRPSWGKGPREELCPPPLGNVWLFEGA